MEQKKERAECKTCGKSFWRTAGLGRPKLYCALQCKKASQRPAEETRRTKPHPCPVCGAEFGQRPDGRPKTCSRRCARAVERAARGGHSPNFKGGRWKINTGYIKVLMNHPRADARGYVLEHLVVMEQKLGRPLKAGERVHHLNGIRDDNRSENLELWCSKDPPGQRVEDLVDFVVKNYRALIEKKLKE